MVRRFELSPLQQERYLVVTYKFGRRPRVLRPSSCVLRVQDAVV